MKINQSSRIGSEAGDWIILNDYGSEGFGVAGQYATPEEAIKNLDSGCGSPQTIVKLPEFNFTVGDDA